MKKLLSTIIASSMILSASASALTASADQTNVRTSGACTENMKSFGDDDFEFDGMSINSYKGSDEVIYIPETIGSRQVQSLGLYAFKGCSAREIHVPDSVQIICAWAFSGCSKLETVTLPENMDQLQLASFENCTSLKSVNLPSNIDTIDLDMFKGCTSLESIHIPDGNIQSIKSSGFAGCKSLKDVYIPQSLTLIGPMAFMACSSLEEIKLSDNTEYIGYWAFSNCTSLKKINLPASVTTIEEDAFDNCPDLVIYGEKGSYAEQYAHDNRIKFFDGTDLYDPSKDDDGDKEYDPDFNYVVNDDGTATITGAKHIKTEVTIPRVINGHKVTGIGEATFANYETLHSVAKNVIVPEGVTHIDKSAFENCYFLENIQLPVSLESIGENAFTNCTQLVIHCKTDSYAEAYAKANNINYSNDLLQDTETDTDTDTESDTDTEKEFSEEYEYVVNGDNSVTITKNKKTDETEIVIPDTINNHPVTGIGEGAFVSEDTASVLTKVVIPEGVTHIDDRAFEHCTFLSSVTFPSTLKTIGDDAFNVVQNLEEVVLPEGLKTIGKNNFTTAGFFLQADMPYSLESIGEGSFTSNGAVTMNVYKDSVAEKYAADNGIASIYKMGEPPQKEEQMIGDVNGDKKVTASDSLMIQRYVVKLITFSDEQIAIADVNQDSKADSRDSLEILRYTIGMSKNKRIGQNIVV